MLHIENLSAGYGDITILRQLSLDVEKGQIVALIGANGAGKTTTLKTISGLLRATSGRIVFQGRDIQNWAPHRIVAEGLIQVPEGRHLFPHMTVLENLELGSFRRGRRDRQATLKVVYDLFPRLAERRGQLARTLSGGEQQMVAIGRALMTHPALLMLDEPSLGLAPLIVQNIFDVTRAIRDTGTTVMIVEQNAVQTLAMSDWCYVLENGRVILSGPSADLLNNEEIRTAYLGL